MGITLTGEQQTEKPNNIYLTLKKHYALSNLISNKAHTHARTLDKLQTYITRHFKQVTENTKSHYTCIRYLFIFPSVY